MGLWRLWNMNLEYIALGMSDHNMGLWRLWNMNLEYIVPGP